MSKRSKGIAFLLVLAALLLVVACQPLEMPAMEEETAELRDARISAEARAAKAERRILELTAGQAARGSVEAPAGDSQTVSALQRQLRQLRAAYDDITGRFGQQSDELQEALAMVEGRRSEQETVAALRQTIADLKEESAAGNVAPDPPAADPPGPNVVHP